MHTLWGNGGPPFNASIMVDARAFNEYNQAEEKSDDVNPSPDI